MKKELLNQLKEKYAEKIIDGRKIADAIKKELHEKTLELIREKNIQPGLAVVLVGDNPASKVYVHNKQKTCDEIGFLSRVDRLPEETSERDLLSIIHNLNSDKDIHGILVQLPLPSHINEKKILYAISPDKDVDGFHPFNVGRMVIGDARFLPCTPAGILELLIQSKIETIGKQVVVIGRSMIVGKPLTNLLVQKGIDATVTLTHSRTKNIQEIILKADIVIAAIGASNFVTRDMIREGSIIIDVGMNRDQDGTLCGDVDFQDVIDKVAKITPVPGGVGPMTIAMLARNTFLSASGESSSQA